MKESSDKEIISEERLREEAKELIRQMMTINHIPIPVGIVALFDLIAELISDSGKCNFENYVKLVNQFAQAKKYLFKERED